MTVPICVVDAFTDEAFAGNPAAVCVVEGECAEGWMQSLAKEMNLSETAYVRRLEGGEGRFGLRWFTPAFEVELCGHATLATAHAVWERGLAPPDETLVFETLSGALTAKRDGEWIELDLPARPPSPIEAPAGMTVALGLETPPANVWRNALGYWIAELPDATAVREVSPDFMRVRALGGPGVVVTAASDVARFDFVSRFFAPNAGIDEDPVCGSAHCSLGPLWGARLGKDELMANQVSPRGGALRVRLSGDRVLLAGKAVTVWRGELSEAGAHGMRGG